MNTFERSTTGQLIANISRELRTPLSAILVFSASFDPLNSLQGLQILVADDAQDNQVLTTRYLEKTGALIDTAYHGEMAVEMSERNHYDAILMDIQMPVMDGLEAIRLLRKRNYKGLILAVTAGAVREQIQRATDFTRGQNDEPT